MPGASTALQVSMDDWSSMEVSSGTVFEEEEYEAREERKSPAALFGSDQISLTLLPFELQMAINGLISDSQKSTLRSDAVRLFRAPTDHETDNDWDAQYAAEYTSRQKAHKHAIRDGTAFATVALPAHYSVITSVLHHVKRRMDSSWEIDKVIDWGAGSGSGLWASLYSFQRDDAEYGEDGRGRVALGTTMKRYTGIDKRDGLVTIGKRLIENTPRGSFKAIWKRTFKEEDKVFPGERERTIALSAFMLTTLPTAFAQKTIVKEMWDSGAHTIVLIDHNTKEGFEAVAHAREYMLELGRAELEDPELAQSELLGSHVLAPCPHDHACPLLTSKRSSLVCGFSQRLQRPSFLQKTKHSKFGHENTGYSYVVIRRGTRPAPVDSAVGRIGGIGKRALEDHRLANLPIKELQIHTDEAGTKLETSVVDESSLSNVSEAEDLLDPEGPEMQSQLRREAYQWPRLVFRPLKKSGHIILDSCTAEGKIMRLTIPKSQGKQPYYDARKSSWGDIFPHAPKNRPVEYLGLKPREKRDDEGDDGDFLSGRDIGKRKDSFEEGKHRTYSGIAENLREKKKLSKREFAKTRGNKVWTD
ncbi:hypothetical protein CPC08DRAFT_655961 [Agrocybe pediades]|nr:hypothetical protein CPC08DRAFT_655961 [Agrocybe pediades]